jgi:hypothetical protein
MPLSIQAQQGWDSVFLAGLSVVWHQGSAQNLRLVRITWRAQTHLTQQAAFARLRDAAGSAEER